MWSPFSVTIKINKEDVLVSNVICKSSAWTLYMTFPSYTYFSIYSVINDHVSENITIS